jgi:hypothetical protein
MLIDPLRAQKVTSNRAVKTYFGRRSHANDLRKLVGTSKLTLDCMPTEWGHWAFGRSYKNVREGEVKSRDSSVTHDRQGHHLTTAARLKQCKCLDVLLWKHNHASGVAGTPTSAEHFANQTLDLS